MLCRLLNLVIILCFSKLHHFFQIKSTICQLAHQPRVPRSTALKDLFSPMNKDLAKIARIALQLPVTQVSVERVFSSWKYVRSDLRMRLGDDVVDAILVLRANN